MKPPIKHVVTCTALASLLACGSETQHNIGDVGALGAQLSDYAGEWDGYAEAFEFADGKDRLRIALDNQGIGVIEVGDSAALPAPSPSEPYPPEIAGLTLPFEHFESNEHGLIPGFEYPITQASVEDARIEFGIDVYALYAEWCAGMAPVPWEPGADGTTHYGCLANDTMRSEERDGERVCFVGDEPIACGLDRCERVCQCDEDGCQAATSLEARFDGALEGGRLVGTLAMGDRITARLMRE